jgi:hypothetical protein
MDYLFFYDPNYYFVDFSEIIIFLYLHQKLTKLRDYWFFDVAWNRWKINETDLDLLRNFTRFSRSRDVLSKSFIIIINSASLDSRWEATRSYFWRGPILNKPFLMNVVKMTFCVNVQNSVIASSSKFLYIFLFQFPNQALINNAYFSKYH